ncbi:peroxiredoxin-like family protein [Sporosarcina limicola]|uniref:thioredoxin-dependent peroxiredoxin n=1 Tax=Sporosarcina limicola TaxID=34101 RepID=A0A927MLW7_9BACL|nr:peroxiredoxin-like family protein [Sporosarcina limicola]MBE1557149.1 peroxiredoxin [Sporosarcina limicola]
MEKTPVQKLQSELKAATVQMEEMLPKEVLNAFEKSIQDLHVSDSGKGLLAGTKAPDFTLVDSAGQKVTLSEETAKGPVVLIFYRGIWCPFCNLELKAYQRINSDIKAAGGQLIAVSPQTPDHSIFIQEQNELGFHVLSDLQNQTAEKYNLKFKLPEYVHAIYRSLDISLDKFNGDNSWEIPVPATYVIDKAGFIRSANVDADYKKRMEPSEVLHILQSL